MMTPEEKQQLEKAIEYVKEALMPHSDVSFSKFEQVASAAKRVPEIEQQVETLQKQVEEWKQACRNRDATVNQQGDEWVNLKTEIDALNTKLFEKESRLKEVEGVAERMLEMMKAMDDDLKENMPEYERIEGVTETFELAKSAGIGGKE